MEHDFEINERIKKYRNMSKKDENCIKLIFQLNTKERTAVYEYAYKIFSGQIKI